MPDSESEENPPGSVALKSANRFSLAHQRAESELAHAKEALERKTEELAQAKERYALAEDATNEGLWDWNPLTKENYLSARWKALLGFAEHDLSNTEESFFARI